jgi:lysophospholipase L1-like esterase
MQFAKALIALVILVTGLGAAEFPKPITSIDLQDGDTFVFLGDSITHQVLYTQYLEDFFYTRYPERRIRFHNAGVSGDKAFHALDRFEGDVAVFKPKYVSVLLGMNDGTYQHFNHEIFAAYENDMTEVMTRISDLGATAILMGPTMYDSRIATAKPPRWLKNQEQIKQATTYYNAVLAFYGTWIRDVAQARGLGYVDMLGPLNFHTTQQRISKPEFTVIPDAVHPDANGQAIMAVSFLEQIRTQRRSVSGITIDKMEGKWRAIGRASGVTELKEQGSGIHFQAKAAALPWILPPEASVGYALTRAGHKLSNERLVVRGLAPGKYRLKIDGVDVGSYTHAQLGAKIELQGNDKTPQYQQALAVALLNKEKNEKVVRPLRGNWSKRKGVRARELEKNAPQKYAEWKKQFDAEVPRLLKLREEYDDRIYQLNQPTTRTYELSLID